jgi:hypothetical protein
MRPEAKALWIWIWVAAGMLPMGQEAAIASTREKVAEGTPEEVVGQDTAIRKTAVAT